VNFTPVRLSVALLGDRLAVAVLNGASVQTFTVDAESPAVALRAELEARRLPARAVSLGVARSAVSVKQIELPAVVGDTREMVGFELERHLPFPAEDAAFDFVSLPSDPSAPAGQRVLITAADRRVVDAALRLAEEARLRPLSLTVAVHNLPVLTRIRHDRRVAWIHRAGEAVDLLLLQGEALLLSRSLPSGEDAAIADEIQRSMAAVRWRDCNAIWLSGDEPPGGFSSAPLTSLGAPVTEPAWTPVARQRLAGLAPEQRGALELAVARSPRAARGGSSYCPPPSGRGGSPARRPSRSAWRLPRCCSPSSRSSPRAGASNATSSGSTPRSRGSSRP
jgi:hypothetical protein